MRKSRVEALLIGLTVLALCAGVVAGIVYARLPTGSAVKPENIPPPPMVPPDGPGEKSLADELQLTPEQRVQMRDIWEDVRGKVHQAFDEAQDLQRQRDERIVALLSDDQKAKFQKLSQEFADRYDQLARERDEAFNSAVDKTKKLLNEEQRKKYEQILKAHVRPGPPISARDRKIVIVSPNSATSQPVK